MTVRDLGDDDYDVVIVGGGPAGLSAGVRCANEGVKTLLIEKDPILKSRKSWVAASKKGREVVKDWGIVNIEEISDFPCYGGTLVTKYADGKMGNKGSLALTKPAGYSVNQTKLNKHLLEQTDKLDIKEKTSVIGTKRSNGRVVIELSNGEVIKAAVLIDASGTLREPSRMLGRKWNVDTMYTCYGELLKGKHYRDFGCEVDGKPVWFTAWGPEVPGSEISILWNYVAGEDVVEFGTYTHGLVSKTNRFPMGEPPLGMDIKQYCKWYTSPIHARHKEAYKSVIEGTKVMGEFYGLINQRWETKPYEDNLLMVGDSAGHANHWMGEGMLQSLIFGKDAGDVAVESISQENYGEGFLKRYYKLLKRDDVFNRGFYGYGKSFLVRTSGMLPELIHAIVNPLANLHREDISDLGREAITGGNLSISDWMKLIKPAAPAIIKEFLKQVMK